MASGSVPAKRSPSSIEDLVKRATAFDFYTETPLRSWLKTAKVLRMQATICEESHDIQQAFIYKYRHAILILEKLPKHPEYKDIKYKSELDLLKQQVNVDISTLESWKPELDKTFESERESQEAKRAELAKNKYKRQAEQDLLSVKRRTSIDAADHRDLTVELNRHALLSRGHSTQSLSLPVRTKSTLVQAEQDIDGALVDNEISQRLQHTRRILDRSSSITLAQSSQDGLAAHYAYPSVPAREEAMSWPATQDIKSNAPPLPSKIVNDHLRSHTNDILPQTKNILSQVKFKIKAHTEGGAELRNVLLPTRLQETFLNLAHSNTVRNLETCGVLCASLISNALFITHLVIPQQTSTSDTCDTTDGGDIALFDYCEKANLIVCGWIHTHPSQTCFLSSRDLHTSAGYQQMMPEAIAIVCSPKHNPSLGIFRLTSPPGLPAVLKCKVQGLFHQHDEQHLYTDATSPGHVIEDKNLEFTTVDLR